MSPYWIVLAGALLLLVYSALRKRLRRQTRALQNQTSRLDQFAAENKRLQRQSDRAVDQRLRQSPETHREN